MKKVRIGVELRRIKWKAAQLGSTGARPKSEKWMSYVCGKEVDEEEEKEDEEKQQEEEEDCGRNWHQ